MIVLHPSKTFVALERLVFRRHGFHQTETSLRSLVFASMHSEISNGSQK